MADKDVLNDAELEGLFQAARDTATNPCGDLVARILADAEAELAGVPVPPAASPAPRRGAFAGVLAAVGGWPAAAGLATAAIAGLTIGYVSPDTLQDVSGALLASSDYRLEDLLPSYDDLLGEG